MEAGKPIRTARGEVQRALSTFHLAAEEATRHAQATLDAARPKLQEMETALNRLEAEAQRLPVGERRAGAERTRECEREFQGVSMFHRDLLTGRPQPCFGTCCGPSVAFRAT